MMPDTVYGVFETGSGVFINESAQCPACLLEWRPVPAISITGGSISLLPIIQRFAEAGKGFAVETGWDLLISAIMLPDRDKADTVLTQKPLGGVASTSNFIWHRYADIIGRSKTLPHQGLIQQGKA
jgi:hypothetical protein